MIKSLFKKTTTVSQKNLCLNFFNFFCFIDKIKYQVEYLLEGWLVSVSNIVKLQVFLLDCWFSFYKGQCIWSIGIVFLLSWELLSFFLKSHSILSISLHSQRAVRGRKICLPAKTWKIWVWEALEEKGTPQIRMHWGSPRKVRSTECVISGGHYSSHYLPFDRAAHWPGMLANGEENSARGCKSLIQVPHEYLVSRIQASDLENKAPPQSKWQAELVSC